MIFKNHRKTISEKSFESAISIYEDCQESYKQNTRLEYWHAPGNTMKNLKVLLRGVQEADQENPEGDHISNKGPGPGFEPSSRDPQSLRITTTLSRHARICSHCIEIKLSPA